MDEANLERIGECGCIGQLVDGMLAHSNVERVQEACCGALAVLVRHSNNRVRIATQRTTDALAAADATFGNQSKAIREWVADIKDTINQH